MGYCIYKLQARGHETWWNCSRGNGTLELCPGCRLDPNCNTQVIFNWEETNFHWKPMDVFPTKKNLLGGIYDQDENCSRSKILKPTRNPLPCFTWYVGFTYPSQCVILPLARYKKLMHRTHYLVQLGKYLVCPLQSTFSIFRKMWHTLFQ